MTPDQEKVLTTLEPCLRTFWVLDGMPVKKCPYCGTPRAPHHNRCSTCGAPK